MWGTSTGGYGDRDRKGGGSGVAKQAGKLRALSSMRCLSWAASKSRSLKRPVLSAASTSPRAISKNSVTRSCIQCMSTSVTTLEDECLHEKSLHRGRNRLIQMVALEIRDCVKPHCQ